MLGLVNQAYGKGGGWKKRHLGRWLEGELWEGATVFGTRLQVVMKQRMMEGWRRGRFVGEGGARPQAEFGFSYQVFDIFLLLQIMNYLK